MRLEKLRLQNFKNYAEAQVEFQGDIHCFLGKNGSGKTNLLDAIHYLAFTRSSINLSDQQNILKGQNHFLIKGDFLKQDRRHEVLCSFHDGQKKIIREDDQDVKKLSNHLGKYPAVMVAPNDIELIWDGSELRRKFFDTILSQIDAVYLENLMLYVHYLKHRNGLLRIFFEQGKTDLDMLAAYDEKLVPAGEYIFEKRKGFMNHFYPLFERHYRFMASDSKETVAIAYRSQLSEESFRDVLTKNLDRDILLQRTTAGIHRDDFLFTIDTGELKRMGSQGQQKSFLIALKLAEFETLSAEKKLKPLLLLDDIFDKLDDDRIHKLMELVAARTFGQLFITDASPARTQGILKKAQVPINVFTVRDGQIA